MNLRVIEGLDFLCQKHYYVYISHNMLREKNVHWPVLLKQKRNGSNVLCNQSRLHLL